MENAEKIIKLVKKYRNSLPIFFSECLNIKDKYSNLTPLHLNSSQSRLHINIEKTRQAGRKVRKVLLKSRQIGFSTYTEARAFSKVLFTPNYNAFIIAERVASTQNIFEMAQRYYDNLPAFCPRPALTQNSIKGLTFESDAKIRLATAAGRSIGRSMTNQFVHCSEVGFYENVTEVTAGLFQTVPNTLETEIILESTANGTSGDGAFFYEKCMEGLSKSSEWDTLFFPWFEHQEYAMPIPPDFSITEEELELVKNHNVTKEQLQWRRRKIATDFKTRPHLFAQEYPATIQQAFIRSNKSLIGLEWLEKARKNLMTDNSAPIVIGVDPARTGDRTVIVIRQGRVLIKMYQFEQMDEMRLAGIIARLFEYYDADRCFIDYGHGTGTYDRLVEQGFGLKTELVNFGSKAIEYERYKNRRAEMFDRARDWFMQDGGVYIKDSDNIEELYRDLMLIPDLEVADSNGKLGLERKEKIVKGSSISSTDFADALAITFASLVQKYDEYMNRFGGANHVQVINERAWEC